MIITKDIELSPKQQEAYEYIKWEGLMPTMMNCGLALFGYKDPMVSNGMYEQFFHILYPKLEQQVVFGTGKGGYKKYGVKKITADFYDPEEKIVYEIDGPEHKYGRHKLTDKRRDLVLGLVFNITTVRITNEEVERMIKRRIKEVVPSE